MTTSKPTSLNSLDQQKIQKHSVFSNIDLFKQEVLAHKQNKQQILTGLEMHGSPPDFKINQPEQEDNHRVKFPQTQDVDSLSYTVLVNQQLSARESLVKDRESDELAQVYINISETKTRAISSESVVFP